MRRLSRLLLVATALTLWGWLWGPATVAQQSPVVGLVINEVGNSIAFFDPQTGRILGATDVSAALSKPHLGAYDATTWRLYLGSKGAKLAAFDLTDPMAPKLLESVKPGGDGEIHWVVLAGGLIWIAHQGDSAVYAYDPADLSQPAVVLGKVLGFDTTHGLAMRPGSDELWATNRPEDAPGFVLRIDVSTHKVIGKPLQTTGQPGDRPNNTAFTPDGCSAYVVNTGDKATQVTVIDPATFTVAKQIEQDSVLGLAPHAIVFDPATQRMFVANKNGGTVSAIDIATGTVAGYVSVGEEPHGVTVGPDGLVYVAVKHDNKIAVVDPRTLSIVKEITNSALVGPHQILFLFPTTAPGT
jgi:YVTN family beta-propeller protein